MTSSKDHDLAPEESVVSLRRTALVTGASRGLGAAIARQLAGDGYHVVINYRSQVNAAKAVASSIEEAGGSAEVCKFDVTCREATHRALAQLLERGPISVLVNNAGIHEDAILPTMSEDAWQTVTRTSLDGFFNVTQPLLMPMITQKFGRIINISSLSGLVGNRGQVNYSAAKAGLIGATRSLAQEVAKKKITVNAVAPGLFETDMTGEISERDLIQKIPMKRLGRPEEVGHLVSFLASERAAYITGQTISINGGLL